MMEEIQKYKDKEKKFCLSQWPRGLIRGSAAVRLLSRVFESRRRHGCLSVVSVCCQGKVSATS